MHKISHDLDTLYISNRHMIFFWRNDEYTGNQLLTLFFKTPLTNFPHTNSTGPLLRLMKVACMKHENILYEFKELLYKIHFMNFVLYLNSLFGSSLRVFFKNHYKFSSINFMLRKIRKKLLYNLEILQKKCGYLYDLKFKDIQNPS
jgi:hypothetical protein